MRLPRYSRHYLPWLILALLLVATALVYWPGTRGALLLDDYPNLIQNDALAHVKPTPESFLDVMLSSKSGPTHRPVAMATFALNALALGNGKSIRSGAEAMKWTNVGIHLLNGLLVFILLRLILGQYRRLRPETSESACNWSALAITGAWLLAPINLTAVLYVIQRMTSLAGTFSLLGLISYVAGRSYLHEAKHPVKAWVLLLTTSLICTPLAILSKEIGALTMLYALVIEWTFFNFKLADGKRAKGIIVYFVAFLALPAVTAIAWLLPNALNASHLALRPFTLGERVLTEGRVIWHYVWWTLVPNIGSLTLYHDAFPVSHGLLKPWTTLPAWIGIGLLLFIGIRIRRRYPLIAFGLLWFIAGQVMTASFIFLELVFEHRQYLPSLGLYTAVFGTALVLVKDQRHKRITTGAVIAIIALYGLALGLRSVNWSNPLRQLYIAAHDHPDSPRATYAYARILTIYSVGVPKLVPKAFKALEKARNVPGQGLLPDATLIILAHRTGRAANPDWYRRIAHILATRPSNPGDVSGLYSLVHCAVREKNPCKLDPQLMQIVFASALTRPHPSTTIMVMYGNYLLNATGQPHKARRIFRLLVEKHPGTAVYHFDLGITELACGDLPAAQRQLEILKSLNRFGISNENIKSLSNLISQVQGKNPRHVQTR